MDTKPILLAVLMALSVSADATDIRNIVADRQDSSVVRVIEPDKAIFGVPYGTSEDDFIERFGKPTGYVRLSETETGMLYGRKHLFLFDDNNMLAGVFISNSVLDWAIAQELTFETLFDRLRWKLDNGLEEGSTLGEAKHLLGDKLRTDEYGYRRFYDTGRGRVELRFSHRTDIDEEDVAFTLHGIHVKLR